MELNQMSSIDNIPDCDVLLLFVNDQERKGIFNAAELFGCPAPKIILGKSLTYHYLGELAGTSLMALQTRMGAGGRGAAGVAVSEAIREIDPEFIVAVGVAFGCDEKKQKIGDILISEKMAFYEEAKLENGKTTPRGDTVTAPEKLFARVRAFAWPPYWKEAPVHSGLLLSGEKLINDRVFLKKLLKKCPEAIGGEMEGAGVYSAASFKKKDWLVIKAVCDYADGNKDENKEQNQEVAAKNAANLFFSALKGGYFRPEDLENEAGAIIGQRKRKGKNKEKLRPDDSVFKNKVVSEIQTILNKENIVELRKEIVKNIIIIHKLEDVQEQVKMNPAWYLVNEQLLNSILVLNLSIRELSIRVREEGRGRSLFEFYWGKSLDILGWLVLISVNQKWVQVQKNKHFMGMTGGITLEIPVGSKAGVEIVFSVFYERCARLHANFSGTQVFGRYNIDFTAPEAGFYEKDTVNEIKRLIWKTIQKEDAPSPFSENDSIKLNEILRIRNILNENIYLLVDKSNLEHPLLIKDNFDKLRDDLPDLSTVFIAMDSDENVLIVSEPELNAQLTEFFRNSPEADNAAN
jgi:nucleoside phosphorylase